MRERAFTQQEGGRQSSPAACGPLFLGIDGGGSKCKARLVDASGALLAVAVAGPANAFQDQAGAREAMLASARQALATAGLAPELLGQLRVGAGLAGVNIPRVAGEMRQWQHPFAALYLETDIHIACLGAHGGADGGIIVAGTGSVGYSYAGGRGSSVGGHGFPAGDHGSGAWLGLRALQSALLALDQLGPETGLLDAIERQLGATGTGLVDSMAGARPREYGALAPLVLECADAGDAVAVAIVAEGADYLTRLGRRLLDDGAPALAMLGGLAPRLLPWLAADVRERVLAPVAEADVGAVQLAMSAGADAAQA
ncbi:ATPase [Seongchinamella sediminis]|uniref:ATPase n=1 Tax=Seongchinamella sediminis TaxID=2283635 RepID=A0A3L7DZN5_9GAMM|nr:BadF/BadG/BcrA/BcrD ATPase family protein [Seongchinamella sediminis]RLQ21322.1 ATPase [Seongchinamella sediminis]